MSTQEQDLHSVVEPHIVDWVQAITHIHYIYIKKKNIYIYIYIYIYALKTHSILEFFLIIATIIVTSIINYLTIKNCHHHHH